MVFKHNIGNKAKPKLLMFMLTIILCLSMIMPMIYQPLQVQAADGDMGAEDGGPATGTYDGGPMSSRTGWLFYCIDLSNNQANIKRDFNINHHAFCTFCST